MNKKIVTVFGSSVPKTGEPEYETAYKLGRILGQNNLNVCTGGFMGIMEAVSKGAFELGAETIGVTLDIYNVKANPYLTKEIKCSTLFERLNHLMNIGDAYIVLQGGTGTLVEMALVWEFINKNMIKEKPVACHGTLWKEIIEIMEKQISKEKRKTGLIKPFNDVDECADYIISKLAEV